MSDVEHSLEAAPERAAPLGAAPDLGVLETRLGVHWANQALLRRALTHHSMCPGTSQRDAYDTLEFLGDALIGDYVVEHIYHAYPEADEGELTALKSEVVSRRVLAGIGRALNLTPYIRVDAASLRTSNERSRDSLCADVLEALVGAIHLDAGREAARAFVARVVFPAIPAVRATLADHDPKGALQQHVLRQTGALPRYETLAEHGERNDRRYTVGVFAAGRMLATGQGTSVKEAGRAAARAALRGTLPVAPETPGADLTV